MRVERVCIQVTYDPSGSGKILFPEQIESDALAANTKTTVPDTGRASPHAVAYGVNQPLTPLGQHRRHINFKQEV